jgi:hypothetical protein
VDERVGVISKGRRMRVKEIECGWKGGAAEREYEDACVSHCAGDASRFFPARSAG